MNDDLRPKHNWLAVIAGAVGIAGSAWTASGYLQSRAGTDDIKALTNNSFQQRLDAEVFKGELKSINIRLERIEKANSDAQRLELRRERRER